MSSILADRQYTLDFFTSIENSNQITELTDEIIQKINKLSKRVGAPSYQKTPVFKRNSYRNKPIKKNNITEEDWKIIRNFKKTKLEKNIDGFAAQLDKIRSNLNKLTNDTYDVVYDNIVTIVKDIIEEENNSESLEKIGESIFEIGSFHKFWSKVYARLYKDLISLFPVMQQSCLKNFKNFKGIFEVINCIDSNEDYNLFCEYNKQNEKRRALSKFFSICADLNIIDKNEMQKIIIDFTNQIKNDMNKTGKSNHIDEIAENICIMIKSGKNYLKNLDSWEKIKNDIEYFSNIDHKKYDSFNAKLVFKFMDLYDEIEED